MTEKKRRVSPEILNRMIDGYTTVTARSALAAFIRMGQLYDDYPGTPDRTTTDFWKPIIDQAAAEVMAFELSRLPFYTRKVGSEGAKERLKTGQAAPSVNGVYGDSSNPHMIGVSDVVEGTTPASQRKPGASSIIAVVSEDENGQGIRPTPSGVDYLIKFIGPEQANGIVNLDRPHKDNLQNLIERLGIRPDQLTQVTLNPSKPGRECNQEFVDVALELGVTVKLLNVGDFIPGVLAASSDPNNYVIVVGRGGYEEGTMAAVAARALGGFMQAKEYKPSASVQDGKVLTLDDLVMAEPEEALVSASFITEDDMWFHRPGIRKHGGGKYTMTTMVVTHQGIKFKDLILQ